MAKAPTKGPTGTTKRAQERYAKRRNEVIDIAAHAFAQRGYHATTIDDLVEATQLQRGGLYHYIGGKKDLLLRIHERFIQPVLAETSAIVADDAAADVKLRKTAHVLMRTINDYRDQVTVFLHEWRVIEDDPEWEGIREGRRTFEQDIADILEQGRQQGVFQFDDVRLTVFAFLGILNYTYQWFDPAGRVAPEAVADYFCDIFLRGILAPAD